MMLGEVYEWPRKWGKRKPCMRGFARWLRDIGETHVKSLETLKILHDEYCCHSGRAPLGTRALSLRVKSSHLITTGRTGRKTTYHVNVGAVGREFRKAA